MPSWHPYSLLVRLPLILEKDPDKQTNHKMNHINLMLVIINFNIIMYPWVINPKSNLIDDKVMFNRNKKMHRFYLLIYLLIIDCQKLTNRMLPTLESSDDCCSVMAHSRWALVCWLNWVGVGGRMLDDVG